MNTPKHLLLVAVATAAAAAANAQQRIGLIVGPAANTGFGASLAAGADLDGDGVRDLVVGLPTFDAGPLPVDSGALRVYSARSGQLLRNTLGVAPGERLGHTVAGLGDVDGDGVPDHAGGNPLWNSNQGRVTLCSGRDGRVLFTWFGENFSEFGTAIAGVGDVNGDGRADLAVGAPHNSNAIPCGVVRCFGFGHGSYLNQVTGANDTLFGTSLAMVGDTNGDGIGDLAIGEPGVAVTGSSSGRVELRNPLRTGPQGRLWRCEQIFHSRDRGGERVAAAGDCNGDGVPDVLVSRSSDVCLVSGANGGLLRLMRSTDAGFGASFAGVGDFDGDGDQDFAIGAPQHNALAGRVTIYDGASGGVVLTLDGAPGEQFGAQVIALGDVDGDGRSDLAIGAPGFRSGTATVGSVQIYAWRDLAIVREFGAGCPGALGVPDLTTSGLPLLGGSCSVRCGNLPSQGLGMWMFGLSDFGFRGNALPHSLIHFGMPACSLYVSIDATTTFLTGTGHTSTVTFASITNVYMGQKLFVQAAMLDPQAQGGFSFSDAVSLQFGTQ
ncbi:MAG: VCBS repeat-containing protein [Planctomycetes bacterium]|nr:VCBS repeat-containing protein [Planctomycetota bacterium]